MLGQHPDRLAAAAVADVPAVAVLLFHPDGKINDLEGYDHAVTGWV
jgi:hypothetical protein